MYNTEPVWVKILKMGGIGFAIGIGITYYLVTNRPPDQSTNAVESTGVPTGPFPIVVNTPVVLQYQPLAQGATAPDFKLPTPGKSGSVTLSQFLG